MLKPPREPDTTGGEAPLVTVGEPVTGGEGEGLGVVGAAGLAGATVGGLWAGDPVPTALVGPCRLVGPAAEGPVLHTTIE